MKCPCDCDNQGCACRKSGADISEAMCQKYCKSNDYAGCKLYKDTETISRISSSACKEQDMSPPKKERGKCELDHYYHGEIYKGRD